MVRIRLERFPLGTFKKLQAHSVGPFKVLTRIDSNAYVMKLPLDYGISLTFKIENLVAYKGRTTIPDDPFIEPSPAPTTSPTPDTIPPNIPHTRKESIVAIWMSMLFKPRMEQSNISLVQWQRQLESDCTWIAREDLEQLHLNLLEYYQNKIETPSATKHHPPIT